MTRYTNFARKRTYVQAGFGDEQPVDDSENTGATADPALDDPPTAAGEKKKRKRDRSKRAKTTDDASEDAEKKFEEQGGEGQPVHGDAREKWGGNSNRERVKYDKNKDRKDVSEQRRLKRIDDRYASTTCFACRETGHMASHCTNKLAAGSQDNRAAKGKSGRDAVGICYRCGSRRHNLSRCPEPVDSSNPLPFASCFVCSGKGHLASSCPKNQSKGVYPNGGCCKLCKETTHLAKDCPLRKQEVASEKLFVGTGREAGADEDDFHTFKRRAAGVDSSEKREAQGKHKAEIKVGSHSGIVKSFAETSVQKNKKKTVFF